MLRIIILVSFMLLIVCKDISIEEELKIYSSLNQKVFKGKWFANNKTNSKLFNIIDEDNGDIFIRIRYISSAKENSYFYITTDILSGTYKENWVVFAERFYVRIEGKYLNETAKEVTVNPKNNIEFKGKYKNTTSVKLFKLFYLVNSKFFAINQFSFTISNKGGKGSFAFDQANITFELSEVISDMTEKRRNFFLFSVALVGVFHLIILYLSVRKMYKSSMRLRNYSSTMIILDMIWNALICISSITISFSEDSHSQGYATVSFVYFFIFGFLEGVFFYYTYNFDDEVEMKKLIACGLFGMIIVLGVINVIEVFYVVKIFLFYLSFLPQIIYNINQKEKTNFLDYKIFLSLFINRTFIPLYMKGVKNNMFLAKTDYGFCAILLFCQVAQILIIAYQNRFGGDSIWPKRLRKGYFSYKVNLRVLSKYDKDFSKNQCAICLSPFVDNVELFKSSLNNRNIFWMIKERFWDKQIYIMKTPCNHFFHCECLTSWMEMKLECPICRKELPKFL